MDKIKTMELMRWEKRAELCLANATRKLDGRSVGKKTAVYWLNEWKKAAAMFRKLSPLSLL